MQRLSKSNFSFTLKFNSKILCINLFNIKYNLSIDTSNIKKINFEVITLNNSYYKSIIK